jgi:hypothetical protein
MYEQIDHDPFADERAAVGNLSIDHHGRVLELQALAGLMHRVLTLEANQAAAIQEMRQMLQSIESRIADAHLSNEDLHRSVRAKKRIVRDKDGRPSHIEIDDSGEMGG